MYDIDAAASVEELYLDMVRLHSAGLLSASRLESLHQSLDEVDSRHEDGSEEHHAQQRVVLASSLRRALHELRQGENAGVAEAWYEGRAYARKLNRAGVREAEHYAKNTLLIAGMMGVPTGKEDLVLLVALPVGGYVVVKVGGIAIHRAAFLLRKLRSVDDVLEHVKPWGLHARYAANDAELRRVAGNEAADAALRTQAHIGAPREGQRPGRENVWNPSDRNDNCTACVATIIRNSLEGYFKYSADEMERLFGYAGRERQFNVDASLRYIEKATGLKATSKPVTMLGGAPVGHYAIFTRWSDGGYRHVVYGRVTPTGRVVIFDPQTLEHMTYQQMQQRDGAMARPFRLEAAE
ncbi:hypothetical protein [Melittangium boletus]|uniref:hypothetical protein n=1 Tax=Melittangium boletus TaxID=83453 RepID=UPI001C54C90B|nr:hypothetical protein [Melittangium boletus]